MIDVEVKLWKRKSLNIVWIRSHVYNTDLLIFSTIIFVSYNDSFLTLLPSYLPWSNNRLTRRHPSS